MNLEITPPNRRILVIDDNEAIHQDFRKILNRSKSGAVALANVAKDIFGESAGEPVESIHFEMDSAFQGREGLEKVRVAAEEGRPYAMAFVDIRMPPGWDGVETIKQIWAQYPGLEVVICTAYSDYSLEEIIGVLGRTDRMLILKKPFDAIEVVQLASSLTEKWRLARAVEAHVLDLEKRVEERTRELRQGQRQLIEARKLEVVGKLAGGISHDFNSYLTAIIGHADLIQQDAPRGGVTFRSAVEIGKSAASAATLTRQLLAFSRQQLLKPEFLDVNAMIVQVSPLLRGLMGDRIRIGTVAGAQHPWTHADAAQLQKVLVSLAHNARDAMPRGGQLTVTTSNVTVTAANAAGDPDITPGNYVVIAIEDSGSGISRAVMPHLFEPFFTTKAQGEGKGLGLAMCHGILKQSHGHITVSSELGRGSIFKLYLPRIDKAREVNPPHEPPPAAVTQGGTEVILLVERDDALRDFAATILEKQGYTVCPASGSRMALSIAGQLPRVDLLLANAVMPEVTGRELGEWICASHPAMKVLLTSAFDEADPAQKGVCDTAFDIVRKPYTPAILSSRVREALDAVLVG
jgi:signal transduction histidine kinase